jgi:hypothetical protein
MQTYLDCYPCFLRQALNAARYAGADANQQHRILLQVMTQLQQFAQDQHSPPYMAEIIHRLVRNHTHHDDPYREVKQKATTQVLDLYPNLLQHIQDAVDPFEQAVRIAIAGNIIDFGVFDDYDLTATLERAYTEPFAIDDLEQLRQAVQQAPAILYLGDNAGETVCDRLLIEQIACPVTYVVKSAPIINDATHEDALAAGLEQVTEMIIDNGTDAVGTLLDRCSESFRSTFAKAPLIIAKGQANYESLSHVSAPVFFLLQAKCQFIAQDLGVPTGCFIVKASSAYRW